MHRNRQRRHRPVAVASLILAMTAPAIASAATQINSGRVSLESVSGLALYRLQNRPSQTALEAQRLRRRDVRQDAHRAWLHKLRLEEKREAEAVARARSAAVLYSYSTSSSPVAAVSHGGADWYAIAMCESGGNWSINSGNGFWGGLQFTPHTWFAYGGGPFDGSGPFPYSAGQQIAVAERVLGGQGPGAWPNCFRWG
jgi:transglycosylase-like protein